MIVLVYNLLSEFWKLEASKKPMAVVWTQNLRLALSTTADTSFTSIMFFQSLLSVTEIILWRP